MKELFLLVKTNWQSKKLTHYAHYFALFFISLGLASLGFSKSIQLSSPDFYVGKFNTFQTLQVSISTLLIFIGSTVKIIFSKFNLQVNFINFLIIVFLLTAVYKQDLNSINYITGILLSVAASKFKPNDFKTIGISFTVGVVLQVFIAIYQLINQKSTNLSLLNFLGEPNINLTEKGISKLNFTNFQLIRPYGTTYHPNFLGGLIAVAIIFNIKFNKLIYYFGIIATQSLSAITGVITNLIISKKTKYLLSITVTSALIILGLKIYSNSYTGVIERINQNLSVLYEIKNWNIIDWIFGSNSSLNTFETQKLLPWEIQPIHNHFLQSLISFGILGLTVFILLLKKIYCNNKNLFYCILPILLLDHYLITLPNGILLLAFILLFKKPLS